MKNGISIKGKQSGLLSAVYIHDAKGEKVPLPGIRSATIFLDGNDVIRATLEVYVDEIDLEGIDPENVTIHPFI